MKVDNFQALFLKQIYGGYLFSLQVIGALMENCHLEN